MNAGEVIVFLSGLIFITYGASFVYGPAAYMISGSVMLGWVFVSWWISRHW